MIKLIPIFLFIASLLVSCAHKEPPLEERLRVRISGYYAERDRALKEAKAEEPGISPEVERQKITEITPLSYRGPSRAVPSAQKLPFSKKRKVIVEVDEMPLPDFIHHVFSNLLGVNYVLDSRIKKSRTPITLDIHKKITEHHLFEIVKDVLSKNNISIYVKDKVFYIWSGAKTEEHVLGIGASEKDIPVTLGQIQQLIPVRYADVNNLRNLIPVIKGTYIIASTNENILVVRGKREQVENVIRFVNMLDRPAMRGRFAGILRLKYWDPPDMANKLTEILTHEGIPVATGPGKKGLYISTLDRWGTILFFAPEKDWVERIKYWVNLLDIPLDKDESRYFLYFPQNSKASELAESLEKILGISKPDASIQGLPGKVPGVGKEPGSKKEKEKKKEGISEELKIKEVGVRIAVDETRNALIMYTTPKKYKELESLINKLDLMPVQVLIEASIAEVTLTDALQYGLEWYIKSTAGSQTSILRTLEGLGVGGGGLSYAMVADTQKFQLLLNALSQEGMIKILSSPRITVRDGKSASIFVGTEVPVITSEATTAEITEEGTTGIIRSVQYRSTGISLNVTPSVHAKGVVTLEISQEVSEAQTNITSDISSPMILNRSLSTEVVAADGQTIIIGGLIKEKKSETTTKVPFLGDIPILGYLFKTKSESIDRTELVIMITPRIIRNTQEIDEMRESILKSFSLIETEER